MAAEAERSGSELTGSIDAAAGATQTATFEVCDDTQELRVALSWVEEPGDGLLNDLDLVTACRIGSVMGALKVAVQGPQNHSPTLDEIVNCFQNAFGYSFIS